MHFEKLFYKERETPEPKGKPIGHICHGKDGWQTHYPKLSRILPKKLCFQSSQWRDVERLLGPLGKDKR